MQSVNNRSESVSASTKVPWATLNTDNQKKKSSTESRISAIHQSIQNQPLPAPVKIKKELRTDNKGKSPQNHTKVNKIAREMVKRKREMPTTNTNKTDGEMSRGKIQCYQ